MIKPAENRGISAKGSERYHDLVEVAIQRVKQGLAPPAEIYRIQSKVQIDWSQFPEWARPLNPEVFDGCCHEG